ncbi:MAG: ABC transporter ATP-binding protein [Christensenellales bacterium]
MNILELDKVSLIYHSLKFETLALKEINLKVKEGEFISIVGPSGCGKTTILSLISGILKASSGKVIINSKKEFACGYMFQKDHLLPWRTILKNICLGLEVQKKESKESIEYIKDLSKKYGIYDFLERYPNELSGGMRQRVSLIRTLALKPDILLLDEPFSALDFQTRLNVCDDVAKIIKEEKKTAILVTHDIQEAISMSDRIVILSARPAIVKQILELDFDKSLTPFQRRDKPNFSKYFDIIWKELTENEK